MKNRGRRGAVDSKGTHQIVSGFFFRVVSAVMGCFLGCLRVKDSTSSPSVPPSSEAVVRKRNRLSSLMLTESMEEEECRNLENKGNDNRQADADMKELKDEEKFLKAWGTLPETPAEIRNKSWEGKCQLSGNDDPEDSKFRSWLVRMPTEQLNFEKESSQPLTPAQKCEELGEGTISLSGQNSKTISIRSDEGNNGEQSGMTSKVHANQGYKSASVVQGRKSVRFYCGTSLQNLSPEVDNETSKDLGEASICNISRPDPYPTPPRLNDEMQTPGTVFSAYQDGMANEKKTRIRSQFVKPTLNPVDNLYEGMKTEFKELGKLSVEQESVEESEVGQFLSGKELNMESKMTPWLKSNVTSHDVDNHSTSQESVIRTLEDRPIIGLVAAHWNEEEASRISPKSWDGNGIPNSTSKYKEDQKVSWHSTPFVERLEKALSDDTIIPQRKPRSGRRSLTEMSGLEESDTAISKLQSSVNIKSIASC